MFFFSVFKLNLDLSHTYRLSTAFILAKKHPCLPPLTRSHVSGGSGFLIQGRKSTGRCEGSKGKKKYLNIQPEDKGKRAEAIFTDPECLQVQSWPSLFRRGQMSRCSHTCISVITQKKKERKCLSCLFFYHSSPWCQKSLLHSCFYR